MRRFFLIIGFGLCIGLIVLTRPGSRSSGHAESDVIPFSAGPALAGDGNTARSFGPAVAPTNSGIKQRPLASGGGATGSTVNTISPALEEQIQAAQYWFAYAGSSSNGSPRLVASVRGQKFDFIAEESGVSVRRWSQETNWSWRMFPQEAEGSVPKVERGRVAYQRSGGVTEWFANGEHGIEQGFTLSTAEGDAVRRVSCRVLTELRPLLRPDADGIDFVDASGSAQLHYDGLHAFDADGTTLRAWVETSSERDVHTLTLAVDTARARFPVTIDPIISLASERIEPPQIAKGDGFGLTVGASGNLIAIGAPRHPVGAVPAAGVVYLFTRHNNCDEEWTLVQKIDSPNPYNNGQFGRVLSLGNEALAVSAHRLSFVNGGDVPEDVVHVYQPNPTNGWVWDRRATLQQSDPNVPSNPTNYFGVSISVNPQGSLLVIGSPLSWSEGGQFPFRTGKAFVYGRDVGGAQTWGLIRWLQPPGFVPNARFGRSVSVDGTRIAVGAPGYFITSTNGSVFAYEYHSSGPIELPAPKLANSDREKGFGERVALSGNQLVVLAAVGGPSVTVYERRVTYHSDTGVTIISWHPGLLYMPGLSPNVPVPPGNRFGETVSLYGGTLILKNDRLVYGGQDEEEDVPIFRRVESLVRFEHQGDAGGNAALNWKLDSSTPAEAVNLRGLANAVVSGGLIVATSTNETYGTSIADFGAAVAMRRKGGTWVAAQRFLGTPPLANHDLAGTSVAVSDDLLVVGAPGQDTGGVVDSGAVHVFRRLSGITNGASGFAHGWTLAATLVNEVPQANGRLGQSVAVEDGLVAAGAPGRNNASGTVWIWKRISEDATTWGGEVVLGAVEGAPGWQFGSAISFNGTTLAAGSPAAGAGRVHLFKRGTQNDWPVLDVLTAHANDARFGAALDLDEADNLIVGSPDASVNGAQSGEAYIYRRTETSAGSKWVEEADPGSSIAGGHAGAGVAIDRGWAFVGAPGEMVDSDRTGRVRIYRRNHTTADPWEEVATLEPALALSGVRQFGRSIALDEHTAVIGAPGENSNGSAFVYSRVLSAAGTWRYTAKLLDPCNEPGNGFGTAVALDHDQIYVGSPRSAVASTENAGTVTRFERQGSTWTLQREVPDDGAHRLGSSVAVSGDWMVIGSTRDWDSDPEGPSDAGQVYVLRRHDGAHGVWSVVQRVIRPEIAQYHVDTDEFGRSVDISDRVFVVGSHIGAYTFGIDPEGQTFYMGRLRSFTGDIEFGSAVAIHGQRIAVIALNSVAFFVRTNEHVEPFGEITITTHWIREARQSVGYAASVDLSDTTAVVGAPGDISISGGEFGMVSVFERDEGGPGEWGRTGYFTDPDVFGDELHLPAFGSSVALDGDTLVVGTRFPLDDGVEFGMGTVFLRHAGGFKKWGKVAEVGGPAVAVSGDWVVSGINSPPREADEAGDGSFRYAALYHRHANGQDQWGLVQQFQPANTNRAHTWNFGWAVALDGTTLVIGAPGEQRKVLDWTPGRAFVYDLPLNPFRIWNDTLFAEQYFTDPIVPFSGPMDAAMADLDNDGVPNAWEAFHGLNPLVADAASAGIKSLGLDLAAGQFVMQWRESTEVPGLIAMPQWSRNLGQWFDSGSGPSAADTKTFIVTTIETHPDHVVKEARIPANNDTRLFTRLVLLGL